MVDQLLIETIDRMVEKRTGRRILLVTSGLLVSGIPIDRHEFLAGLDQDLFTASSGRHADEQSVVHLKDVVISNNAGFRQIAVWRGSLDAVSGWAPVDSSSEVLEAFDASWQRNEAGYRYLAGR